MGKFQYFDALEHLSASALEAVRLCGEGGGEKKKERLHALCLSCTQQLCELEAALFHDFLPPLERQSIAACAHVLFRILNRADELLCATQNERLTGSAKTNAEICLRLAQAIHDNTRRLRAIRKPSETPDLQGFRKLLSEVGDTQRTASSLSPSRTPSRAALSTGILWENLRKELGYAFDQLIEVMLTNI